MKKISTILLLIFLSINPTMAQTSLTQNDDEHPTTNNSIYDPFEDLNRQTFKLNKGIDTYGIKPITVFYKENTPKTIQKGVSNFLAI